MRQSELPPQAPPEVQETTTSPELNEISPPHLQYQTGIPNNVTESTDSGLFNQMTNPAGDGGETCRPEKVSQKYHFELSYKIIALSLAFWLLTYLPIVKKFLDINVVHSISLGMLLRLGMATLAEFSIWRKFYNGALNALCRGAANEDVVMILATSAADFYSVYPYLRAACYKDLRDPGFFGIISMLNTFIQLWESIEVIEGSRNENVVPHKNATEVESESVNGPVQQFTNRMHEYFVPLVVIIIARATWFAWFWTVLHGDPKSWPSPSINGLELAIKLGISISLIACFCGVELETPAAVMLANGIAESRRLMIKADKVLETAHKVNCIILTKIGTIMNPRAEQVISTLKSMGIRIVMVTSDSLETAPSTAKKAGEANPEDQAQQVKKYRDLGYTVAIIRQDINDLPALKAADVIIAIGADANGGCDGEAADVVLGEDNLEDVITVLVLSRKFHLHRFSAFGCSIIAIVAAIGLPVIGLHFLPGICAALVVASLARVLSSSLVLEKYSPRNLDIHDMV